MKYADTINPQPVLITSHLKKVFWPNIRVGHEFQILEIQQYSSGLKFMSALILNQNPFFEMACSVYPEMASFTQCRRWADNLNPQNIPIFLRFKLSARRACPAAPRRGSWAIPPWRDYHFWMDTN